LDPKLDVALVEQGTVGYGGSGRNAGMVMPTVDHSHGLAISHFGLDEARKLASIGLRNIDELAEFAADCDFERTGLLVAALTPKHIEECHANVSLAIELGLSGHRVLSAEEFQAEVNSPLYIGGSSAPGGGNINPVKLVDKIKRKAEQLGVRIFEMTRVLEINGTRVRTENGSVSARLIVLATDAYTHHLFPKMLFRYIPLYDYIIASEPLTNEQRQSIGWRNRQGMTDGRNFFNYYRLTKDDRILWGTSEAKYHPPNRVGPSCDHSEEHYRSLKEGFKLHFPELTSLEFPYQWGGPIASTTRFTPFFGSLEQGKILYALGYTGHGIGSTRLAGKILAYMAVQRPNDLLNLKMVTHLPFPYPPEPLRSLSVKIVTKDLQRVDQGKNPSLLLRLLNALGIGLSS
jgi:glycine/D-amino acid oxidase-like deaminating enzyme